MTGRTHDLGRAAAYPLAVGGATVIGVWTQLAGHPALLSLTVSTTFALAIIVLAERVIPFDDDWNRSRGEETTDAAHSLVGLGVMQVLVWLAAATAPRWGLNELWPAETHAAGQVAAYLVIAEFLAYWSHRALHRVGALWRLHTIHHTAERLYWLNGFRFHPLDVGFSAIVGLIWASLFGVPELVVTIVGSFTIAHLLFQHSNVDAATSWLSPILATPEFHRWHHVRTREDVDVNYSGVLGIFDVLFGTYRSGAPDAPHDVGLDDEQTSKSYLGQLLDPWR